MNNIRFKKVHYFDFTLSNVKKSLFRDPFRIAL